MPNMKPFIFGDVVMYLDEQIRRCKESIDLAPDELVEEVFREMLYAYTTFKEALVDSYVKMEERK